MTGGSLERSRQDLAAAELLIGAGFPLQATSRAYYAAFYAAEEAIAQVGEVRRSHAGVISAFTRSIIRERGLDPVAGDILRSLFARRLGADYAPVESDEADARVALADASRFVELVAEWLADQS